MNDAFSGEGEPDELTLLPEVEARKRLHGRMLSFRLLVPPFPALGVGVLRTLRVSEGANGPELIAGYDRYERLEAPERP